MPATPSKPLPPEIEVLLLRRLLYLRSDACWHAHFMADTLPRLRRATRVLRDYLDVPSR